MSALQIAIENESFVPAKRKMFLDDTVSHYNSTNRGVGTGITIASCSYKNGCAVGRHLDMELCVAMDNTGDGYIKHTDVFKQLPEWMKSLDKEFLSRVQKLHDNSFHWNENGLSESGKQFASKIETEYCY